MTTPRFDPERHEYFVGRVRYPSITERLKALGFITDLADDEALWRGTVSHKAVELYLKGTLDFKTLDEHTRPRLEAFITFEKATGFKPTHIEVPLANKFLQLAGTPDLAGILRDGSRAIVELKSGDVYPWTRIQTAMQAFLLDLDTKKTRRFGLKLGKNGKPSLHEFKNPNDYVVAMSVVNVYNWLMNTNPGGFK